MNIKTSLTQKFSLLLLMFVSITATVLTFLVSAKNEPIDFAKQEMLGNAYQIPVEKALKSIMQHRIVAQRALYGEKSSATTLPEIQKSVDAAMDEIHKIDAEIGADLQFTDAGLAAKKREHYKVMNVSKEWSELKSKISGLKPAESNDLHAHLIADLRNMVTHLGDMSNLILDPDLDSYYLMDITLLALPQAQDRIQNVIVEMEPIIRRKSVTLEERIKASVFASMMSESDLERIKADIQTALNEDPNFYGKSDSLEAKINPAHQKFVEAYKALIDVIAVVGAGGEVPLEKFLKVSDAALNESFDYWHITDAELDHLIAIRRATIEKSKIWQAVLSVIALMGALAVAFFFMRHLVQSMHTIMSVLKKSSDQLSGVSYQTAASATELSEATTKQASSLQETMASAEEISAMVGQNADSAAKTKDTVDSNQAMAESGSASVNEMMTAISEIKTTNDEILQQMEASNKEFGTIVKIISEIGDKTNVINEIVFQTKLLSFNASVEAARAGEHGKGFAVVAEEVGNLAQMSGNAAKEITDMLSNSIKKVNEIVENTKHRVDRLVEIGKDKITMGQSTAQKCQTALEKINSNAKTMANMIAEITTASKEQAQGVQEINNAIAQLDNVIQQNSVLAQHSSGQAEELRAQAQTLNDAVHKLVAFVDGKVAKHISSDAPTPHHHDIPADITKKVVSISSPKAGKKSAKKGSLNNDTSKKAVGTEDVPSSNNPNFDDF